MHLWVGDDTIGRDQVWHPSISHGETSTNAHFKIPPDASSLLRATTLLYIVAGVITQIKLQIKTKTWSKE
jgi:hypothetical protein